MFTQKFNNLIDWFEIPVTDMKRARKYYETIFQMKMQDMKLANGLEMSLFPVEEGQPGGALACHPKAYFPSHEGALLYMNANPDLSRVLDRVEEAGGKAMVPKTLLSEELGYMALIEDSEGNRIGLRSRK